MAMTGFDDHGAAWQARHGEDDFQNAYPWYSSGVTLEEAHEVIRQIPLDPEWGNPNPTEPRTTRWSHFSLGDRFLQLRLRELFEGYTLPHGESYFLGLMAQDALERDFLLWHDREMREELIWPLFSLQGTQEISFANVEKFGRDWAPSLVALEQEGLLDRERLLDEMLTALNRGFPTYRVRWFTRHYNDFNPTEAETTARQHHLVAALASGVGSTITFAVNELAKLSELDVERFLPAAPHAFASSKAAGLKTLKMLRRIAGEREGLAPSVAEAAVQGLYHEHDDVVRAAAALLGELGRSDLVEANAAALSPAMAKELLSKEPADAVAVAEVPEFSNEVAEPVTPWTDGEALFRTRELLAAPDAVGCALLVAWLAETGPRALDILQPVIPKHDPSANVTDTRWLLSQCARPPADVKQDNASVLKQGYSTPRRSLLPVIDIVHGRAPTRTLLSTPTDTFGRVDNEEFARRLATYAHRDDIWADDAMLAHLRLLDYQEDTTGLVPVQGAQAGCHCYLYEKAPKPCDSYRHKNRIWERTARGWQSSEGGHDTVLPHLLSSPFNAVDSPAARAIVAPSCLDLYTYEMEPTLNLGLTSLPEVQESGIVDVLAWHPGEWTPHTAKFLGMALAHFDPEVRSIAAEIVATKLASAIAAEVAAQQWAQIDNVILGRWAASLTDAATLNPAFVRDLLTFLLPQLDRKTRDMAKLIELYRNVRLQTGHVGVDKRMREWLESFSGKSKAAQAAAALLKETET